MQSVTKSPAIYQKSIEVLSSSLLFKDTSGDFMQTFYDHCEVVAYGKNELFNRDLLNHSLFIPLDGIVKNFQVNPKTGKEYIIFLLKSGDIFDIVNFVEPAQREVLFEILQPSTLLRITYDDMRTLSTENPNFSKNIIPYLAYRIRVLEENASDLALYPTISRLSKLILKNIQARKKGTHPQHINIDKLSHETIAKMIGSVRSVVTRHMKTLKKTQQPVKELDKKIENLEEIKEIIEKIDNF